MNYLKTLKDLFAFMKNTRLPETQMKELQNQKLRTLLHFAWERSAFYRRTFEKAGITEEQLDSLPLSAFPFDIFPLGSICSTLLTFTLYGVDISPLGSIIRPISKNRQSGRSNSPHPSPESRRRCKGGGGQAANGPARAGPNPLWAVGPDVFRVKERKSGQKRAFCQTWVAPQASPVPSPWKQGGEGLFLLPQS